MDCPKCGKSVPKYSAFCGSCGTSLGRSGTSWGPGKEEPKPPRKGPEPPRREPERRRKEAVPSREVVSAPGPRPRRALWSSLVLVVGVALFFPPAASWLRSALARSSSAAQASPDEALEGIVLRLLGRAYETDLRGEGFRPALRRFSGALRTGGHERLQIALPPNTQAAILGVCDLECGNLDLVLRSATGEVLEADTARDTPPLLLFTTGPEGGQVLEVRMVACTVEPCYYAAGVFVR